MKEVAGERQEEADTFRNHILFLLLNTSALHILYNSFFFNCDSFGGGRAEVGLGVWGEETEVTTVIRNFSRFLSFPAVVLCIIHTFLGGWTCFTLYL